MIGLKEVVVKILSVITMCLFALLSYSPAHATGDDSWEFRQWFAGQGFQGSDVSGNPCDVRVETSGTLANGMGDWGGWGIPANLGVIISTASQNIQIPWRDGDSTVIEKTDTSATFKIKSTILTIKISENTSNAVVTSVEAVQTSWLGNTTTLVCNRK